MISVDATFVPKILAVPLQVLLGQQFSLEGCEEVSHVSQRDFVR
jgi:hypothetical protein